jgi:NAD(P)-dependent dehydrogenase (short-subunit alcohol dehydrogenase family)
MNINNKVAIVTGGASGLGRATVEALISAGAKVAIFDVDEDKGESLSESLGEATVFCKVNVADDAMIEAGMDRVMQIFGAIHVCVNCAGRGGGATKTLGRSGRFPMELFRDVININLVGTFSVLTRAAEKMSLNEPDENGDRGVIVNTASIAAYEGQKGQVAYAASKGGIVSLTLPVARDLAYFGIRVVTVAPGIFDTPILQGISDEVRDSLASSVPHPPRLGDVNDFSALVQHIVTNPYINGETIRLDGGLRMS